MADYRDYRIFYNNKLAVEDAPTEVNVFNYGDVNTWDLAGLERLAENWTKFYASTGQAHFVYLVKEVK